MSDEPFALELDSVVRTRVLPGDLAPVVSHVVLLDLDAELAHAIPEADLIRARRALLAPALCVPAGEVALDLIRYPAGTFALLLLDGALTEETRLGDGLMREILLPGDVLLRGSTPRGESAALRRVNAVDPVRLVALDARFLRAAAVWPGLLSIVQARVADRLSRVTVQGAICQLPRTEERIMAMMRHLADRLGTVGQDGIRISWPTTHQELAELIGARRPTVSLAVKALRGRNQLQRRIDGTWLLPHLSGA